jgi:hypothetical protein
LVIVVSIVGIAHGVSVVIGSVVERNIGVVLDNGVHERRRVLSEEELVSCSRLLVVGERIVCGCR